MKKLCFLIIAFSLAWGRALAAPLSADDFLPPVQASSEEARAEAEQIQQPDAVTTKSGLGGGQAIAAASAQDAVNAAVQRLEAAGGCEEVIFPSGFGFVATGVSTYGVMPNATATLSAQRHAYQIAYMQAKKALAEYLNGIPASALEQMKEQTKTIISDTDSLANTAHQYTENLSELVQGFLRGYVVYNVNDQQEGTVGTVYVTIVSTPKTMGKGNRVDPNSLTADSVKEGLQGVLTELSTGLLPPVGGKVIGVPQTGELAFVGFGSAVVPDNPDPAVRAKLVLNAQKMAQMRARSALCGIILGDDITAASSLDSSTSIMSKQFEEVQKEDPVTADAATIAKLDSQRQSFLDATFNTESISSMRKGVVPPGVNVKTFLTPEKTMAEAVAVYLPSMSARAANMAQDMKNSSIVPNAEDRGKPRTGGGQMPQQGPSGQVTNNADL